MRDLTGQRFGRLTVIERRGSNKHKKALWLCVCDCGNKKIIASRELITGDTKSCGCIIREKINKGLATKHGLHKTRLYRIWCGMKERCGYANNKAFKHYGGRGISVCEEWKDNFQAFYDWAMANGYTDELTIDRIDVNGNYEPANCRWATWTEQQTNKRNNKEP